MEESGVQQNKMSVSLSLCFSSEDELDVLLNGTPEQKKKLIREYLTGESESSSGDEFEKEMEAELSSTIRTMEGTWGPSASGNTHLLTDQPHCVRLLWNDYRSVWVYTPAEASAGGGGGGSSGPALPNPRMYDKVYFDSDSDEEDKPSMYV